MPKTWIDSLQFAIVLSGVVTFLLAGRSLSIALKERSALLKTGQNGALAAAAFHHLVTASLRAAVGVVSITGGITLLLWPDVDTRAGVLSGDVWLSFNILLIITMLFEGWARAEIREIAARHGHK